MKPSHFTPIVALLCLLTVAGACSDDPSRPAGRVVVLGLDGVDPRVVDRMIGEGRLPAFERLRSEGARGPLRAEEPLLSPILWTTIATGRPPTDHGIAHFTAIDEATGKQLPVTSQLRKVPALWNLVSDAGDEVAVVGWWATWPAERVNGAIVSDHVAYHFLFEEGFTGAPEESIANTWPLELEDEIAPMLRRPSDVGAAELEPFADVDPAELERAFDFDDELQHLRWALATAWSHQRIARHLWETREPDLLLEYVEGTDSVSHLFGHLVGAEGLVGDLARQQERFGGTVEAVYEEADRLVAEWLEELADEPDATLVVLSDHGFRLGELHADPRRASDMRRVSERFHEPDGVLFLHGRGVREGARIEGATQLDVAPTVLALLGLPATDAMPGRVLAEALTLERWPERVSADDARSHSGRDAADDSTVDAAILERLESLGYVGAESPASSRSIANMLFERGEHAAAEAAYRDLLESSPDDPQLLTNLAGAVGAQGHHDEALVLLERSLEVEPMQAAAWHNRAVLLERADRRDEAVDAYRRALRIDPTFEEARRALFRLTGTPAVRPLESPEEERAVELAEQARQAAVRGDFPAASRALDEAEQLAPHLALVHHHRSNVAFLAGDREAARRALERALEIEPDNVLFQRNLRALGPDATAEEPTAEEPTTEKPTAEKPTPDE